MQLLVGIDERLGRIHGILAVINEVGQCDLILGGSGRTWHQQTDERKYTQDCKQHLTLFHAFLRRCTNSMVRMRLKIKDSPRLVEPILSAVDSASSLRR